MGGARNLKLGARARAQWAIIFVVWAKCQHYSIVVCIKKTYSVVQGQSLWSGVREQAP